MKTSDVYKRQAKRLSDLTGMEAKTIHRLLEAGFAGGGRTVFARSVTCLLYTSR